MAKYGVEEDEWYPVWSLTTKEGQGTNVLHEYVDIPEDLAEEYNDAYRHFKQMLDKLRMFFSETEKAVASLK